ncbi:aspartate aminotransferase family protein [Teredinibacter purpureus]|uniref:aspartate aminotransferase family protein n=1 Tax=Teredinibacter purpureus TaxID=2731756 RepID=UPI0005F7D82C|nr:aminotransferase class III-fold pyridoxal phosphate-dependent enzyme [Teredinibacter purpureus]
MNKLNDRDQVVEACEKYWNPAAAALYRISHKTLESHAKGSWVYDENGDAYLDFACSYGVFVVGHGNPEVIEAADSQIQKIGAKVSKFPSVESITLRKAIAESLPEDLNKVWLASTGAEACEIAMRAAMIIMAPRKKLVVIENSYHGKTLGALGFLGQTAHRLPFGDLMSHIEYVPFGDVAAISSAIDDQTAAVLVEPILGGPFLQVPPLGYLKIIESRCKATGTLFIADEIQTAFGRAGKLYAIDYDNVVPDMILLSKGLTGGATPFAALVMKESVHNSLGESEFYDERLLQSENGGSPYACSVALAAINFITRNNLILKSDALGARLLTGLHRIAKKYPKFIIEARGVGLMTGLCVRNSAIESAISMVLGKKNVHTGHSLNETIAHPVLRFYPPLTVTPDEIDLCLTKLEETMAQLSCRPFLMFKVLDVIARRQYKIPSKYLYKLTGIKPIYTLG